MSDLIKLDDTLKIICDTIALYGTGARVESEILSIVSKIPPVEVKTAQWIPVTVSSGRDSWECSACGRRARGKLENLPYCHCGAKMEAER